MQDAGGDELWITPPHFGVSAMETIVRPTHLWRQTRLSSTRDVTFAVWVAVFWSAWGLLSGMVHLEESCQKKSSVPGARSAAVSNPGKKLFLME